MMNVNELKNLSNNYHDTYAAVLDEIWNEYEKTLFENFCKMAQQGEKNHTIDLTEVHDRVEEEWQKKTNNEFRLNSRAKFRELVITRYLEPSGFVCTPRCTKTLVNVAWNE